MDDAPLLPGELHAAFVVSAEGNATIDTIDASDALVCPLWGVSDIYLYWYSRPPLGMKNLAS